MSLGGSDLPPPSALTAIQDPFVFLEHDTHPQRGSGEWVRTGPQLKSGSRHIYHVQVFVNRDLSCITLTRPYAEAVIVAGVRKSEQLNVARGLS